MFTFDQLWDLGIIFCSFFDQKDTFWCPFKYRSSLETRFSFRFVCRATMTAKSSSSTDKNNTAREECVLHFPSSLSL